MKWMYSFIIAITFFQPLFSMDKILHWQFTNPRNNQLISLGEKGSVQEALIKDGYLPDPYVGMNEDLFGWIEEHIWELSTSFYVNQEEIDASILDLEFPSVDTYAKIYLNGELILNCENAFHPYRINVNKLLKAGTNELRAVFTPPILFHKEFYENAAYKLPAQNDVHKIAIAPYTRKPQYQFGWDWALRMNTIGFNKPVALVSYKNNKIIGTNIQTTSIRNNEAIISLSIQLANKNTEKIKWNSNLFGEIDFKTNGEWLHASVTVKNPQLWWPKNHGEPFLYEDKWTLFDEDDHIIETQNKKFGIRSTQLIQEKDQYGTSYEIMINSRKIFCMGGNYIPQEMFPAKVTDESIRVLITQLDEANFNMIRVWGGGYYPDDVFYEECDKRGIMVWQDFMFACSMYPGTDDFLENVKTEVNYQIPRMTSHPSVVLLNGNNEVDMAWKNWGFQLKYGLYGKPSKEIEKAYDAVFMQLIPSRVTAFTTLPYIHTSPLSNWGSDEFYNHGSQHYWGVWHGKDPIEDFGNKIGRFNAEYGFQSFPEYSTLAAAIQKSDWNLESEVMRNRQKSPVGNGMIKKHADHLFGKTSDFETFIYYSQLTQAKGVGLAISGHRTDWPRCAGTIYWQINDCWPAPTWSSIDYFGNWKALHYEAQKDYQNIAVLAVEKKLNQKEYFIVSDWTESYKTDVTFNFYDLNGKWLVEHTLLVDIHSQNVLKLPINDLMDKQLTDYILTVTWKDNRGTTCSRTFHNTTSKYKKNEPTIELKIDNNILIVNTDKPLFNCWIYSEEHPIHLNQNFETLLPGSHYFTIKNNNANISIDKLKLNYLNK